MISCFFNKVVSSQAKLHVLIGQPMDNAQIMTFMHRWKTNVWGAATLAIKTVSSTKKKKRQINSKYEQAFSFW